MDNNLQPYDDYQDLTQSIRLGNPYVAIICISKYTEQSKGACMDLPGCDIDRKRMINLWCNTYKFNKDRIFINDETGIVTKKSFIHQYLRSIKNKISDDYMTYDNKLKNQINDNDCKNNINNNKNPSKIKIRESTGIIFVYSGHGGKDSIILSDGESYEIPTILKLFNGEDENCPYLVDCPKIFIFDCCRGDNFSLSVVCL